MDGLDEEILWLLLLWNQTKGKISKRLGIDRQEIDRRVLLYPNRGLDLKGFEWDDESKSIVHGLLLGDGGFRVSGKSCSLTMASSHRDFPEWCRQQLHIPGLTKVYNNHYQGGVKPIWKWCSPAINWLACEYTKWWPRGSVRKEVPKGVLINQASALVWWLGDGSMRGDGRRAPTLCTDGFSTEDVVMLGSKLSEASGCSWGVKPCLGYWEFILPRVESSRDAIGALGNILVEVTRARWEVRVTETYWKLRLPYNEMESIAVESTMKEVIQPTNKSWRLLRYRNRWRLALPNYQAEKWFSWLPPCPPDILSLAHRWPNETQRRRWPRVIQPKLKVQPKS